MPYSNSDALSISDITRQIKKSIEQQFDHVRIKGEISSCHIASSGHAYFSLKDEHAVMNAICWRSTLQQLKIQPQDGMEVIATGSITTYAMRSNYQIIIEHLEPSGEGALLKLLHERKKKLQEKGVFDETHKKNIPFLPQKIGIITSPTGAVIEDIKHRISDRFPCHILLYPVTVQGEFVSRDICQAIADFHTLEFQQTYGKVDVIIIARGGGSLEDLWGFNDEALVEAIFHATIPIISAIGHETDHSLCDYVADKRAPTPTASAEFVVPDKKTLQQHKDMVFDKIQHNLYQQMQYKQRFFVQVKKHIPLLKNIIQPYYQQLHAHNRYITNIIQTKQIFYQQKMGTYTLSSHLLHHLLTKKQKDMHNIYQNITQLSHHLSQKQQQKLDYHKKIIEAISYKNTLKRGYAIVKNEQNILITQASQIQQHETYHITFSDEHSIPMKPQPIIGKS